jgi:hypothetical protein
MTERAQTHGRVIPAGSRAIPAAVALALALLPIASAGTARAVTIGPNINVTQALGSQREGAIAINPSNPAQIFIAAADAVNKDILTARSNDGGLTWTRATVAIGNGTSPQSGGLPASCCNLSATFDSYGNLFITYLGLTPRTYVIFGYSIDGGASFKGVTTAQMLGDQPTVAAGHGEVWLTYSVGGAIQAAGGPVTGLGQVGALTRWNVPGAPGTLSASGNYGDITIGPSGQVMLTYGPTSGSSGTLYVNSKPDGLGPAPFALQTAVTNSNIGGFSYIPAQPQWGIDPEAGLAWDHSGGARDGRVYFVNVDAAFVGSTETHVYVRHSDNEGATWSAPVQVSAGGVGASQFMPRISLDQASGAIGVTWWDTRNDPLNTSAQYFGAFSSDGGETFAPDFRLSAGTSNEAWAPNPPPPIVDQDLGDYTGNAFVAGKLWGLWADNSNSTADNPNGTHSALNLYAGYAQVQSVPPAVSVSLPALAPSGWYTASPVTGSVTATEPAGNTETISAITCTGASVSGLSGLGTGSATAAISVAADGITPVACTAANSGGGSAESQPAVVSLDTLAPTLAPTLSVPAGPIPIGAAVTASPGAVDPLNGGFASGLASSSCGVVETAAVGARTLSCQASDLAGNTASAGLGYVVGYATALLAPAPGAAAARGSVLQVQFRLTDAAGNPIPDAVAKALACGAQVTFAALARCPRYKKTTHTFAAQLRVPRKLVPGTYQLTLTVRPGADTLAGASVAVLVS